MGTMVEKGQGVFSSLTQYAVSIEQKLLHYTFAWVGTLEGVLLGSYKGARSLQPHFTSTEGFKELLYGSRHKHEMQHQSITDLLKSWIPNFSSSKQRDVKRSESPSPSCCPGLKDRLKLQAGFPAHAGAFSADVCSARSSLSTSAVCRSAERCRAFTTMSDLIHR